MYYLCVDVCHVKHLISPLWKDAEVQGCLLPVSAGVVWTGPTLSHHPLFCIRPETVYGLGRSN